MAHTTTSHWPAPLIHPLPDPTVTNPLSTIHNISHRFSRLYANHKRQASSKDPYSYPHVSCATALSKSMSLKERNEKSYYYFKKPEQIPASCIPPTVSDVVGGGGVGRRSLDFHFLSCSSGVKVVAVDMPPFMQVHAVDCARKTHDSLEKFTSKTLAHTLKTEFDGVYGPAWHCIVGTSFGSFVTHSVGGFMYFSMDHKMYILLFKTTVQMADH